MTVAMGTGISAYANAMKQLGTGGQGAGASAGAADASSGGGFADFLKNTMQDAMSTERAGESASLKAAAGKADINNVITAVNNAELTLQTVVAVRDKVVQAYQQILQMPV